MLLYRPLFGSHGRNFRFDPDGFYTYRTIFVGDDVAMTWRPTLMAALATIRIGNKVMFGPHVTVIAGGHNITVPGRFMTDVHEKTGNEDLDVVIEDDVWVGTRAVILRGVRVGRGAVIAAGAVVTKSVPPYSLVVENPARILRFRWDVETILSHEMALYPPDRRFSREDLERWQKDFTMLPPLRKPS
jgi:acetyltransferase-like isoleucine patch superfamily enzyme